MSCYPLRKFQSRRRLLQIGVGLVVGASCRGQSSSAGGPQSGRIRVLCYNIHHGEGTDAKIDLSRLARVIRSANPDLVALQEVDDRTQRTGGVDQTAELARLTELHGRFGKQIDYEGGGYGQAILSRFPLSEVRLHVLPGTPTREQRVAVEVGVSVNGLKLSFVTTHLHHMTEEFREQQARKLNEVFAASDHPVILTGDLNATPGSPPLRVLSSQWSVATADPSLLTYPATKPLKQIDYVLFRPRDRFRVIATEVIDEAVASDHRPVLAVLQFDPQ